MKKLYLLLAFFSLTFSAKAQQHPDYSAVRDKAVTNINKFLTVKGVELKPGMKMTTLLNLFLDKGLEKSSFFDDYAKEKGVYDLRGTFFSERDCEIQIIPTTYNKNIVGIVAIAFPKRYSFKDLKSEYDRLKSALCEKYYLAICDEKFDDSYVEDSSSDYLKLRALSNNEATFESDFYVSDDIGSHLLGQIVLRISTFNVAYQDYYYIALVYGTSDNILEQLKEGKDDL